MKPKRHYNVMLSKVVDAHEPSIQFPKSFMKGRTQFFLDSPRSKKKTLMSIHEEEDSVMKTERESRPVESHVAETQAKSMRKSSRVRPRVELSLNIRIDNDDQRDQLLSSALKTFLQDSSNTKKEVRSSRRISVNEHKAYAGEIVTMKTDNGDSCEAKNASGSKGVVCEGGDLYKSLHGNNDQEKSPHSRKRLFNSADDDEADEIHEAESRKKTGSSCHGVNIALVKETSDVEMEVRRKEPVGFDLNEELGAIDLNKLPSYAEIDFLSDMRNSVADSTQKARGEHSAIPSTPEGREKEMSESVVKNCHGDRTERASTSWDATDKIESSYSTRPVKTYNGEALDLNKPPSSDGYDDNRLWDKSLTNFDGSTMPGAGKRNNLSVPKDEDTRESKRIKIFEPQLPAETPLSCIHALEAQKISDCKGDDGGKVCQAPDENRPGCIVNDADEVQRREGNFKENEGTNEKDCVMKNLLVPFDDEGAREATYSKNHEDKNFEAVGGCKQASTVHEDDEAQSSMRNFKGKERTTNDYRVMGDHLVHIDDEEAKEKPASRSHEVSIGDCDTKTTSEMKTHDMNDIVGILKLEQLNKTLCECHKQMLPLHTELPVDVGCMVTLDCNHNRNVESEESDYLPIAYMRRKESKDSERKVAVHEVMSTSKSSLSQSLSASPESHSVTSEEIRRSVRWAEHNDCDYTVSQTEVVNVGSERPSSIHNTFISQEAGAEAPPCSQAIGAENKSMGESTERQRTVLQKGLPSAQVDGSCSQKTKYLSSHTRWMEDRVKHASSSRVRKERSASPPWRFEKTTHFFKRSALKMGRGKRHQILQVPHVQFPRTRITVTSKEIQEDWTKITGHKYEGPKNVTKVPAGMELCKALVRPHTLKYLDGIQIPD